MSDDKRKLKNSLLTTFFKKAKPAEDEPENHITPVAVQQHEASEAPSTSSSTNVADATNINDIGVGKQPLGKLVVTPFNAWKHAVEIFNRHQNLEYHKCSVLRAERRLSVAESKEESIEGHRYSGPLNFVGSETTKNDGNFRALLRLRVKSGDENLREHLTLALKKSTYISLRIQNELVNSCNSIIVNILVNKVNASKSFFSVLADEPADISRIEQLSLCVRYVEKETLNIREDFLQFVPVPDVTGKGLANSIMETINKLGINSQYMVGQGYDGVAAMIGSIYNFFNTPKRQTVLETAIDELESETSVTRLKQLCSTRWIQRHESVLVFLELQQATIDALEVISLRNDKTTSSTAVQLLAVIRSIDFQTSLQIIAKLFAITLPLNRQLQTKNQDLSTALELATDVENILTEMRNNAEQQFHDIFVEVSKICDKLGIDISIPRRASRQTQRCNIMTKNPEDYYRISIFIPFLENVLTQIQERLLKHKQILSSFRCLFPVRGSKYENCHENDAKMLLTKYESICNCGIEEGTGELKMWWCRCLTRADENDYPKRAIDFLRQFTTATNERSFSTLRRLKTYLQNTIGEDRLNGLALLNIHREIIVAPEQVLDDFAKHSPQYVINHKKNVETLYDKVHNQLKTNKEKVIENRNKKLEECPEINPDSDVYLEIIQNRRSKTKPKFTPKTAIKDLDVTKEPNKDDDITPTDPDHLNDNPPGSSTPGD
ncbi:hypothetical protein NQ314_011074 [Rhamnusium bicolor]|uniref:52 kDa repressor of the inhibitor of the protein kinase-like n=1 Tax=Rhamnusium bicolor TaxID=1586634 RepID=A0AAV8XLX5_9CUCU|nr:hypothetical protein NQ314_011074 [Rhamnusium bicolor]